MISIAISQSVSFFNDKEQTPHIVAEQKLTLRTLESILLHVAVKGFLKIKQPHKTTAMTNCPVKRVFGNILSAE